MISNKFEVYPRELKRLITSPNINKVGVGLISDIQRIWADLRDDAMNMTDVGIMAKLWLAEKYGDTGYSNLSLETSTAEVLGYRVDKEQQTSDWKSDLSNAQLRCKHTTPVPLIQNTHTGDFIRRSH